MARFIRHRPLVATLCLMALVAGMCFGVYHLMAQARATLPGKDTWVDIDFQRVKRSKLLQDAYALSAYKKYELGTKLVLPDGRVFRYAYAGASNDPQHGCWSASTIVQDGTLDYASAIGTSIIYLCDGTFTANQLAGDYIMYGHGGTTALGFRRILSNTASAANDTVQITIEFPLQVALANTDWAEIFPNPYADVRCGNSSGTASFVGVPAVLATSGDYFWVQTWGPCWCTPGAAGYGYNLSNPERQLIFDNNGSLQAWDDCNESAGDSYQHAGFVLERTSSQDGTFFMLQVSP